MNASITFRILRIIDGTTVDGPGFRTSIYFAGCAHQCPGCHNPQSWDFQGGDIVDIEEVMARIVENDMDVSFSGGDPLYQLPQITELARRVHAIRKSVWCYTGFSFEELLTRSDAMELLRNIDVLVDGPFVESLRDTSLLFRGSSNQRLIDIPTTLADGEIRLWKSVF